MGRPTRVRVSGVYALVCKSTGWAYIGSALDLEKRRRYHFNQLRSGKHHNRALRYAAVVQTVPEGFEWRVLEECSKGQLDEREHHHIKAWDGPTFNILRDPRGPNDRTHRTLIAAAACFRINKNLTGNPYWEIDEVAEGMVADYKEALEQMDWYYPMSDDMSVYQAGRDRHDELLRLADILNCKQLLLDRIAQT